MAENKVKLDRTEHMEERLRKAEQGVEKLEQSLHLANAQLKKSQKRIELLEMELKKARQDFANSDKGDNQENENINIAENGDHRQQKENESSINVTKKNGQANLKLEGPEFIIAPKNRRSAHDTKAFSAYWANCSPDTHLRDGETIPFNAFPLNHGLGFYPGINAFLCPVAGIYLFTTTVTAWQHKVEAEMVYNGIPKAYLTTGNPQDENHQSTISAIFYCGQQNLVWVRILNNHGTGIQCGNGKTPMTTFSGVLLWEDPSSS
ncbi:hypothetical protein CHS0354_041680 [Potamilus streckersoni]|uniref:C1q domain-containing protein n=1 Tax=Potamilus streckersoni TaxID=2493646 RepID=A0AAE0SCJ4_9BIVA|nr:hypothetical protein CHS0354_041680 [Potamilus streckersoni]